MKKRNKKGSHISLVLSFIIFVVSLIFVYTIGSASIVQHESKVGVLLFIEENVKSLLYSEVLVIRTHAEESANCIRLIIADSLLITGGKTLAIADDGMRLSRVTGQNGNNIFIQGGGFVKVYYSKEFSDDSFAPGNCEDSVGDSWIKEKRITEGSIVKFMSNFSGNYSLLKEKLNIPADMEYNIYFEYDNGTIIGSPGPNPDTEVYLREVKITYLNPLSDKETGRLFVQIW